MYTFYHKQFRTYNIGQIYFSSRVMLARGRPISLGILKNRCLAFPAFSRLIRTNTVSFGTSGSLSSLETLSTPSFGPLVPPTSTGSSNSTPVEVSNVSMHALSDLNASEMHGPWLLILPELDYSGGKDSQPIPSGELLMLPCGTAYYRPGAELGYGVGKFEVTAGGMLQMRLEIYVYAQTSKQPATNSRILTFEGIVQNAKIGSHNAEIYTCNGKVALEGSDMATGEFQMAKMANWNAETQNPPPYAPNEELMRELEKVIPPIESFPRRRRVDFTKHSVGTIPHVYYVPEWVTTEEESTMLRILKNTPSEVKSKLQKRLVQEYGGSMCSTCNTSFVSEGNLPTWCNQVCDGLLQSSVFTPATFPNNVRVHEYQPGEGIAPHVDGPIYVPRVAILSLAAPTLISFYPRREPYANPMDHYDDTFKFDGEIAKERPIQSLILEPRSLLVFSSDAYWLHPHGITDKLEDSLLEEHAGPIVNRSVVHCVPPTATKLARKYRVGVTVRNLLPRCNHQPTRAEYFLSRALHITEGATPKKHIPMKTKTKSVMPSSFGHQTPAPYLDIYTGKSHTESP